MLGNDCRLISLEKVINRMPVKNNINCIFTTFPAVTGSKGGYGSIREIKNLLYKIDKTKKAGLLNVDILIAIQLNEGCRLLEEKIVKGYKVIDDTISAGYHIPGPFITGKRKFKEYAKILEDLAEKSGKQYLLPCELMSSGKFLDMKK